MRTTLTIDNALLHQLKQAAARADQTLSEAAENAIRAYLAPRAAAAPPGGVQLPVSSRPVYFRPGVNLDHMADVYDLMDEEYHEKLQHDSSRR